MGTNLSTIVTTTRIATKKVFKNPLPGTPPERVLGVSQAPFLHSSPTEARVSDFFTNFALRQRNHIR